jgi:hypothetical protein
MMLTRLLIGLALSAGAFLLGCADRVVQQITTETADWSYVLDAWGGVTSGEAVITEDTVSLPLALGGIAKPTRMDSAICVCGASMAVGKFSSRVLVSLKKCVCGSGANRPLAASMPRERYGEFEVVYNDPTAGFPYIGELSVPMRPEERAEVQSRVTEITPEEWEARGYDDGGVDLQWDDVVLATSQHGRNLNLIPAERKDQLEASMTAREIFEILGPGYNSSLPGLCTIEWFFDDDTSIEFGCGLGLDLVPLLNWNPPRLGAPTQRPELAGTEHE